MDTVKIVGFTLLGYGAALIAGMALTASEVQRQATENKGTTNKDEGNYGVATKSINGVPVASITLNGVTYWRAVSGGAVYDGSDRLAGATWMTKNRPSNAPEGDIVVLLDGRLILVNGRTIGLLSVSPAGVSTFTPVVGASKQPGTNALVFNTPPGAVVPGSTTTPGTVVGVDPLRDAELS